MNLSNVTDLKSTLTGLMIGVGQYWFLIGEKFPETPAEWMSFVFGVTFTLGGAAAPNSVFTRK